MVFSFYFLYLDDDILLQYGAPCLGDWAWQWLQSSTCFANCSWHHHHQLPAFTNFSLSPECCTIMITMFVYNFLFETVSNVIHNVMYIYMSVHANKLFNSVNVMHVCKSFFLNQTLSDSRLLYKCIDYCLIMSTS